MNNEKLLAKLSDIEDEIIEQQKRIYSGDFEQIDLYKTLQLIRKLSDEMHDRKNNGGVI